MRVAEKTKEQLTGELDKTAILDSMSELVAIQDAEHRVIWANKTAGKSVNLSPEQLVGRYCYEIWPERSEPCVGCPVAKARETGEPQETEMTTPDGRVWFIRGYPIRDANGDITALVEVTLDVTERKQAEEALQQSNKRFADIAQNALEWIWEVDAEGKYTYASAVVEKILGYKPSEILGKYFYDLFQPDEREELKKAAFEVFAKKRPFRQFINRNMHKNGEVVWLATSGVPILDEEENLLGYRGADVDITESKRAEEALKESEEKYKALVEDTPVGIYFNDFKGRFLYGNKRAEEIVGYKRKELIGQSFLKLKLLDSKGLAKAIKLLALNKLGKATGPEEFVLNRKDGTKSIVEIRTKVTTVSGRKVVLGMVEEITERKRAEEALADEVTRRRILVDQSRDGIVILDEDGKVYEANQRFAEMLGYSPEEVRELNVWDWEYLYPPERVREMIRTVDEAGDHFETQHRRKDGSVYDVEISTNGAVIAGQKLIFCVCRDITERKQAERALLEAEEKYKNFVEATSDLVWEADGMGTYTFVSPKIKDILGYEVDEVVGKKRTLDFAPEEEKRKWLKRFKEINAKRVPFFGFEITHLHKNGDPEVFEVSGAPFADSAGNFKGYVGVNKDITERKQAEEARREAVEALRESQEFSSSLLENSPNPIFVVNPDTSVKYVNPAFEKLTGFTLTEITGEKAPYPWWLEEQRERLTASLKNAMSTGGRRSEKVFQKKKGERFFVALNSAPIVHEGKLLYFLINWLDITERKQAEKERGDLEQKAHLASRLASVGEMASGIAHEINNPLTAVIGFAQLLMDTDLPDEVKEDIGVIHKEAQRAAGVARNLLTFARKHVPTKQPTNLNTIIEGVLKLRAYEQSVSNIKVNTHFALDLPEVMADYSQMQQVFINIILNAESAMLEAGNGGTMTITTEKSNGTVRASFADSGPGIAKENINRIFDPFFTTKEVGKGTGLGLSVCHGIVAEHGGRIYAKSRLGKGATFIVELPINAH